MVILNTVENYDHSVDVLNFLIHQHTSGHAIALVVVTATEGGSVRSTGAIVGVSAAGVIAGHISNGCVDAALMAHAIKAIDTDTIQQIKYGKNSPYADLKLPCGGSIDLMIIPNPKKAFLQKAYDQLRHRQPLTVIADRRKGLSLAPEKKQIITGNSGCHWISEYEFLITISPKTRLRIAGVGAEMMALTRIAIAAGFEVIVQSPNQDFLHQAKKLGATACNHLRTPTQLPQNHDDRWTAFVLMFHDHDWELDLLKDALEKDAFYIGALGSQKTHAVRCDRLHQAGINAPQIARIRGPLGLIPSLRDASMVALSCMAEIIQILTKVD